MTSLESNTTHPPVLGVSGNTPSVNNSKSTPIPTNGDSPTQASFSLPTFSSKVTSSTSGSNGNGSPSLLRNIANANLRSSLNSLNSSNANLTSQSQALPFTFSLETPSYSSGTLEKYLKNFIGNDSINSVPDMLKPQTPPVDRRKDGLSQVQIAPSPIPSSSVHSPLNNTNNQPNLTAVNNTITPNLTETKPFPIPLPSTSASSTGTTSMDMDVSMTDAPSNSSTNTDLIVANTNNELIPIPKGTSFLDITEYLNMPQSEAAKKLGIPPSTMSKRWKEAVRKRKWPYRVVCKIDKEIMTLLHNVPQGPNAPCLSEELENALGNLLRKRQEELRPVIIRI